MIVDTPILELPKNSRLFVAADFHGDYKSFSDAWRIVEREIDERNAYFVILGDILDGFPYSYEIMSRIMWLKDNYGDKIVLILGDHEYARIGGPTAHPMNYAATEEEVEFIKKEFHIAAEVGNVLLLHGGVPKGYRTIWDYTDPEIVKQMVWNDPDPRVDDFVPSPRVSCDPDSGIFLYGQKQLREFLRKVEKDILISGHGHVNDTPLLGQIRVCSSRISKDKRTLLEVEMGVVRRIVF